MLLWFIEKLLIGFLKTFSFSIKTINCYRQKYVAGVGVVGKLLEVGEVTDCEMDDIYFLPCMGLSPSEQLCTSGINPCHFNESKVKLAM
jgi:hypothetical protein